jgi:hypothetical protein
MSDIIKLSEVQTTFTPKKNPSKSDYATLKTSLAKFFDKVKDVALVFGNEKAEGQSDGTQDDLQLKAIVKEMNRYDVYRTPSAKVVDKIVELMTSDVNTGKYDLSEVRMALISKDVDVLKLMKQLDDKKIDVTKVANEDFIGEVCSAAGITNTEDLTKVSVEQKNKKLQEKTDLENKKTAAINDLNEALKPDSKDISKVRTAYLAVLDLKLTEKECPGLADAKKIVDAADYQAKVDKLKTPDVGTDRKAKEINTVKNGIIKLMNDNASKFALTDENVTTAKDAINTLSNNKDFRKKFVQTTKDEDKINLLKQNKFPVMAVTEEIKQKEELKKEEVLDKVQTNKSSTENLKTNDSQDKGVGDDVALAKTFIGLYVKDMAKEKVDAMLKDSLISKDEALKDLGMSSVVFDLIDNKMNAKGAGDGFISIPEIKLFNDTIDKYVAVFGVSRDKAIELYKNALGFEMVDLDTVKNTQDSWSKGTINGQTITKDMKYAELIKNLKLSQVAANALTQKFAGSDAVTSVEEVGKFLAMLALISKMGASTQKEVFGINEPLPKFSGTICEADFLKYLTESEEVKKDQNGVTDNSIKGKKDDDKKKIDFQSTCDEALKNVYEFDPATNKPAKVKDAPNYSAAIDGLKKALEDAGKEQDQITKYQNKAIIINSLYETADAINSEANLKVKEGKRLGNASLTTQGEGLKKTANEVLDLAQVAIDEGANSLDQTAKAASTSSSDLLKLSGTYANLKAYSIVTKARQLSLDGKNVEALKLLQDNKKYQTSIDEIGKQDGYGYNQLINELTSMIQMQPKSKVITNKSTSISKKGSSGKGNSSATNQIKNLVN